MAEGCNLYLTKDDFQQIEKSVEIGSPANQRKSAGILLRCVQKTNFNKLMRALGNVNQKHYRIINSTLVKMFGEGKITQKMESTLGAALYILLKDHPNPQGLFEKPPFHRGPGSTSVDHPYEINCAAALVQADRLGNEISSTGQKLQITKTDRIDLGQKSPSNRILSTSKKATIESDILIQRNGKVIGIDAKYTNSSSYSIITERQLKGVKSALQDGSLTEFHFVTNAVFSQGVKNKIDEINKELIANAAKENRNLYNNIKIATKEETESISALELAHKLDFHNNRQQINELVKDYVPQIGYCEKVIFKRI